MPRCMFIVQWNGQFGFGYPQFYENFWLFFPSCIVFPCLVTCFAPFSFRTSRVENHCLTEGKLSSCLSSLCFSSSRDWPNFPALKSQSERGGGGIHLPFHYVVSCTTSTRYLVFKKVLITQSSVNCRLEVL